MKVLTKQVAVVLAGWALTCLAGCGRDTTPPAPATQAASTQPTTLPGPAVLTVGGEPTTFSVVRLEYTRDNESLHLHLSGADAETQPTTTFAFLLTVDTDEPETLPGKAWKFTAASDGDIDAGAGFFLASGATYLQPKEVTIDLGGVYPYVSVNLRGVFLRDGDDSKPVQVNGTFTAMVVEAERGKEQN